MTSSRESSTVPGATVSGVPIPAAVYGGGGLVPFVATAVAAWVVPTPWITAAIFIQLAYGATILSFLGAAHWGLALAGQGRNGDSVAASTWTRLGLSVVPALIAWASLIPALVPRWLDAAILVQMVTFAGVFLGDLRAVRDGLAPAWYPSLRKPLTVVVILALGASLLRMLRG